MSWTDMDLKTFAAGLALGGRFGGVGRTGGSVMFGDTANMNAAIAGAKAIAQTYMGHSRAAMGSPVIIASKGEIEAFGAFDMACITASHADKED